MRRKKRHVEVEEISNAEESFSAEMEGQLTIDVYQTPEEIVVQSTVAGVDPSGIEIDATSESLTIRGERHRNQEVADSD
ncbi:hypothetical protein KKH05_01735, partial [Patescibacteria group bacterium]|nr:hypothetical protein [Patescibacteria group bacterium]